MSEIKALYKLRAAGRNMAKGRNLENHEECNLLLVLADEIQAEVDERFVELPTCSDGIIRLGDDIGNEHYNIGVIDAIAFTADGYEVYSDGNGWAVRGDERHVRPRTLEDVIYDIAVNSVQVERYLNGVPVIGVDKGQLRDEIELREGELREVLGAAE